MIISDALISDNKEYRYELTRVWEPKKPKILYIGLNPSTADETDDDQTIRKLIQYSKNWGYGGLVIVNVFAYRSRDWKKLVCHSNPIGVSNKLTLQSWAFLCKKRSMRVMFMWGRNAAKVNPEWVAEVEAMFLENDVECFQLNMDGSPVHPLMLPYSVEPIKYVF
jgi:hypothetical protein